MSNYVLKCGDCVEILNKQKEGWVDLVVTSPPYDNLREYHGFKFDYQATIKAIFRCLKQGGVCVWVVADQTKDGSESGNSLRHGVYAKQIGFNLHDTMVYAKHNPVPLTHNRYEQAWEFMYVWTKGPPKTFNPIRIKAKGVGGSGRFYEADGTIRDAHTIGAPAIDKIKGNVWEYSIGNQKVGHPAVFPLQLAMDHILSWSNIEDIVLDPMTGSSTTGVAALKLGRKFVGIDISQEYIDISEERLKAI